MQAAYIEAHGGPEVLTYGQRPRARDPSPPGKGPRSSSRTEPSGCFYQGGQPRSAPGVSAAVNTWG